MKIKERKDIPILKDIPLCKVDKYWSDVEKDFLNEIYEGYKIMDQSGFLIATVVKFLKKEKKALLKMPNPINYFELVKLGISMNKIVFDLEQNYLGISDINYKPNVNKLL